MNICIVTEYFPHSNDLDIKGGVEVCAFNEAHELSKYNNVTVLTSKEDNENDEFYIDDIHVICCGKKRGYVQKGSFMSRLNFMRDSLNVGRKLDDIDLVIGYNFITYPIADKIAKKHSIPLVARYHDVWIGNWVKNMGITGLFGEVLERDFLKQDIDLILPVSDFTKKNLLKYVDESKVKTIHNIVDFPSVESDSYKKPTISCVARLVEYKRVEDLIRAVNIVKKSIPDIQCKIIGTGPLEDDLKELTKELNLEDNVEFLGFVEKHEDVMKVVNSSRIFCLPSIVEGFGIVVIEALSLKTPFVAAEIDPVVEASSKKGGLFFKPKDYNGLSECILKLLNDEKLYEKLQEEGYEQSKNYTKEVIGKKLNDAINSIEK
ncbi:MAG: glycosyltransferase family 4 protein [Methanosphaera sp.]|nr:glycosyltransferase family 4 protein [Methanosphaera sp.]